MSDLLVTKSGNCGLLKHGNDDWEAVVETNSDFVSGFGESPEEAVSSLQEQLATAVKEAASLAELVAASHPSRRPDSAEGAA